MVNISGQTSSIEVLCLAAQLNRQAAVPESRPRALAMSRGVAPSTTNPRKSTSIETVWSAAAHLIVTRLGGASWNG